MQNSPHTTLIPKDRRLLEQVSDTIRLKPYSYRTGQTHKEWIKRYSPFHGKSHPKDISVEEIQASLYFETPFPGISRGEGSSVDEALKGLKMENDEGEVKV